MDKQALNIINNVYTALCIWEVVEGNPNGDPDNNGAPRVDPETGHGRISPQAPTSRAKHRVGHMHNYTPPFDIYIRKGTTLEQGNYDAAIDAGLELDSLEKLKASYGKDFDVETRQKISTKLCSRFFDARLLGAVTGVGKIPGETVNGVVTFAWGRSVYPVTLSADTGTRSCAVSVDKKKDRDMSSSARVMHGVYRQPFFVNPHHAQKNGATMRDLALMIDSIINAYEYARSGMSGQVRCRGLWLWRHNNSKYGDAPAHVLLESVKVSSPKGEDSREWSDYSVTYDDSLVPDSIELFRLEQLLGGSEAILKTLTK